MSDMRLLPFTPAASQCAKVCSVLSHSLRGRACYLLPWRVFGTTEVPLDARAAQASPSGSHNSRPPPPPRAATFDRRQLKCPAVRLLTDEDRFASAAADRFCQHASTAQADVAIQRENRLRRGQDVRKAIDPAQVVVQAIGGQFSQGRRPTFDFHRPPRPLWLAFRGG